MRERNKRGGFTLLEIIIVIVIVGTLASLALPRFFTTIEFSKSIEAFMSLGTLRGAMERCYMATGDYNSCPLNKLDIEDPGSSPGSRFSYALSGTATHTSYTIVATRNTIDGGDGSSKITLTQTATGVTRSGTGKYAGIR